MIKGMLCSAIATILIFLWFYYFKVKEKVEFKLDSEYGTAQVYYEDNGIPHIYAENRLISSYALGYVHSVDRLWQIESMRRISQGTLSEVFGEISYGIDETMRLFDITNQCDVIISNMDKESLSYLEAYTRGVNKYVKENSLPFQFQVFWVSFKPWSPKDACTLIKFMHLCLNLNWGFEIISDYIAVISGDDELAEQLYSYDFKYFENHTRTIISDEELSDMNKFHQNEHHEKPTGIHKGDIKNYLINDLKRFVSDFEVHHRSGGSNSWVISGNHTKSGKPIFVNDPHLSNNLPSTWHLSHIEYPDGSFFAGACIPGIPFYGIFSSDKVAGGVTAIFTDNSDIYEEKIFNDTYLYEGKYIPLKFRQENIIVRWNGERNVTIRSTHHGPLINK